MCSLFSKRPTPPSGGTRKQLQTCFEQFKTHVEQMFDYFFQAHSQELPPPFTPGYRELTQKIFSDQEVALLHARVEAEAAVECLENARKIWPKGKKILHEFHLGLEGFLQLVENGQELYRLSSRGYPLDMRTVSKIRQITLENRKTGASSDSHMQKGLAQLRDGTGLEIHISYYD